MGPSRSSFLRIRGNSSVAAGSGRTGGASYRSAGVVLQDAQGEPHFPLNKGKGRIDKIKYPGGSEYLKSAVQNALAGDLAKLDPCMGPFSLGVIDLLLVSGSGPPTF